MVRTTGEDAAERQVIDDIARHGWHCVQILAKSEAGPYSFTVGLQHSYGHPELIIFGLSAKVAHQILCIAAEAIQKGALDLSQPTEELVEGYPCVFVKVPESAYLDHVGFCRWYYRGNGFGLQQIVWPNRDGQFPWHPAASAAFCATQPVLGVPLPA